MDDTREGLSAEAMQRLWDDEPTEARAELLRIAESVHRRRCRTVGLFPATDDLGIAGVALELGLALALVTGGTSTVIDARGTCEGSERPHDGATAETLPKARLADRLTVLRPRTTPGSRAAELDRLLREQGAATHVVVDLSGFAAAGEHVEAVALLDGAAVVARAGRTTRDHLAPWMHDIAREKNLGVLLLAG